MVTLLLRYVCRCSTSMRNAHNFTTCSETRAKRDRCAHGTSNKQ